MPFDIIILIKYCYIIKMITLLRGGDGRSKQRIFISFASKCPLCGVGGKIENKGPK